MDNKIFVYLTDISFERNWKQAVGFYFVYLISLMVLNSVITTFIMAFLHPEILNSSSGFAEGMAAGKDIGRRSGMVISFLMSVGLSLGIIWKKKSYSLANYGCLLAASLLAFFGGIFGLVPVAFLTTRPKG